MDLLDVVLGELDRFPVCEDGFLDTEHLNQTNQSVMGPLHLKTVPSERNPEIPIQCPLPPNSTSTNVDQGGLGQWVILSATT